MKEKKSSTGKGKKANSTGEIQRAKKSSLVNDGVLFFSLRLFDDIRKKR